MFKRRLEKIINNVFSTEKNLVVTGARQVGKSTLLRDLLPADLKKSAAYLSFDDPDLRLSLKNNAIQKISQIQEDIIIFDEVHKLPEIFDILKYYIDNHPDKHCYLTGSSQILLQKNIQESLAGRVFLWDMYPLAFSELFDNRTEILLDRILENQPLDLNSNPANLEQTRNEQRLMQEHQKWGGFPAVWNIKDPDEKYRWLLNYKRTYLEKDIRELSGNIEVDNITRYQYLVACRSAQILSYTELARDCAISVSAAKNYLKLFELTYQIYLLKPYYQNQHKRMIKSPKLYFMDTGLAQVITGEIHSPRTSGAGYETWVLSELVKWQSAKMTPPELFYYRTSAGLEIDFLIKYKNEFLPIEVKAREKVQSSDVPSLKRFLKDFPASRGIVVYQGNEIIKLTENILAIPDRLLFL